MKRSTKIAIPLLLLAAMLITALSVFVFTATAADSKEATLRIDTINYGTDSSKESYGYEVSTTNVSSETGSFAALAEKLAELSPEVDTRYTLTLNSDVTVSEAFTIAGNEHVEVWINLGGHKITSTVDGPMLVSAGSGAAVRIWGDFNADGSYGSFTSAMPNAAIAKISAGSTDRVNIKYVDATFSGNAEGSSMLIAEGGKLVLEHSVVTHTSGKAVSMVSAKGASVDLKYSEFWGDKSGALVNASSSNIYIEGGEMIGSYIVVSDDTASNIVMTGFSCEVDTGFVQGSADTKTYILGSSMEIYTAIANGAANADNLIFYYGDGTTYVIGQDPSEYGLGNTDCSYVESAGTWTMVCSSAEKAVGTVAVMGSAPETGYFATPDAALEAGLCGVGTDTRSATATTLRVVALVNDYSSGASGCTAVTYKGNEDTSVIFDLNGHTLSYTSSDVSGNCPFTVSFGLHFTLDGADVSGNKGTISTACRYAKVVYTRQSSYSGQINYHTVTTLKNTNIVATNLYHTSATSSPVLWITAGYAFIDNVSITYTGTAGTTMASTSLPMLTFGHTPFKKGVAFVNGLTISSTATNGIPVYGMTAAESWRVFATNYKTEKLGIALRVPASGGSVRLENSTLHSNDAVFAGAGNAHVYDTTITTETGLLCSGSIAPTFYYGMGKTVIYTKGNILTGSTSTEEGSGYRIGVVSDGVYKLISDSDAHSLSMPVVFSNGMMLQRNKKVNIYGFCRDIGSTVKVTIGDKSGEAIVDANGEWCVSFASLDAARGVTITIKQIGKGVADIPDIVYEDVNIGEIWVMSGQSNASLYSGYLEDLDEVALLSETLGIREFTPSGYSLLPDDYGNGTWKNVTASVVKEKTTHAMSAAGYTTVARLAAELGPDVPVGLITLAQGSTKIKTWLDYDSLYELSPSEAAKYDDCVANNALPSEKPHTKIGTILYNRHIHPLEGFTTAGVMWYQGCGDIPGKGAMGTEGSTYTEFFTALEKVFRNAFDNGESNLPFYVMQLAPYSRSGDGPADGSYIYAFKLEQYDFCKSLDNTYLVPVAVDGMAFTSQDIEASAFIHPARKSPVGNRTADMILANEYGIKFAEVVSYPQPLSAVRNSDGTVTITFDTELKLFYGDTPEGFELTADGTTWKKATGTIDGNKLILSGVSGAVGVRYGSGRTQVELRDGTVIEVAHSQNQYTLSADRSYYTVTDALTGNKYIIRVDSTDCVRTKNNGNITNASGIPLVLFSMDVVSE